MTFFVKLNIFFKTPPPSSGSGTEPTTITTTSSTKGPPLTTTASTAKVAPIPTPVAPKTVLLKETQIDEYVDRDTCKEAFQIYDKEDTGTIQKEVR